MILRVSKSMLHCSVACIALVCATGAWAQEKDINIPAEDGGKSIPELARQAGVQIIAPGQALHGVVTPAVKGAYEVRVALADMLQGTDLRVASDNGQTIVLAQNQRNVPAATVAAAAPGAPVEEVVVTGSRVISSIANSPTPLTVVTAAELLSTTPSNLSDALNKMPVFINSATQRNAGSAAGNTGGDFLNLRNFGQQRTLVLLDGMRLPAGNQNGSVDISTLPQELMTRVDVVTAGASSVYGSDAITGVVNFILDKNFTGIKYDVNAGISAYQDGFQYKLHLAAGSDLFGGRGHIEGAVGYQSQDGVLKESRPSGAEALGSYNSGANATVPITNIINAGQTVSTASGKITCSSCTVNGQEFVQPGIPGPIFYGVIPVTPGSSSPNTAIAQGCVDCAHVNNTSIFGATRNATAFGRFSYNIDNDTTVFTQLSLAQANVFNYFFPEQQEGSRQTITYFKDNAFLPAATQVALGNNCATDPNCHTDGTNTFQVSEWYNAPGRVRATNNVTRNIVSTTGVNGVVFKDFAWDAHYTHGETRLSTSGIHNGNNQFHDAAQDAVIDNGQLKCWNDTAAAIAQFGDLYPGCVPINTFGNNVTTNAQNDYWGRTTHFAETNIMDDIAADISGTVFDLPAGPVKVALAGEMRWLDYTIDSNASPTAVVDCTGLRLCGALGTVTGVHAAQLPGTGFISAANQQYVTQTLWDNNTLPSVHASDNVWEFSGEVGIPILKDIPLVQSLNADLAGRYTNYSISGSVETWKVGLDYHVNDSVRFRGTTSVDIRAPTLNDLYSPQVSASGPFLDPLTNFNPGGIQTITQGNPKLVPETSRTYTAGVVLTPSFIPGLTMSADYYNIKVKNAIGTVSGSNLAIANLCIASGGSSPFCSLYVRPFPYTNTTPANYPTLLLSQNLNAAFAETEGEDYEVDYNFYMTDIDDSLAGIVNLRGLVNVAPVLTSATFQGAPLQYGFGVGGTTPSQKGHATIIADYTLGNWSVDAAWHWFSGLTKNGVYGTGQVFYANNYVGSFST
ncbi:MAG TPA: TonB-dependent receptor, partial [Rhizomicrobium sp.]|nr:TonB-dependent receptor [Rhizomicrobium sp.]